MGSGSASKTRLIIEAVLRRSRSLLFMPVDISASAIESSSRILLQSYPRLAIEAYAADYFTGLDELGKKLSGRTLALFLGSNISNFDLEEAMRFLQAMRSVLQQRRRAIARRRPQERSGDPRSCLQRCARRYIGIQPQRARENQSRTRRNVSATRFQALRLSTTKQWAASKSTSRVSINQRCELRNSISK